MGPKKETKKGATKNHNGSGVHNIDDPINTESWKCVVMMAVGKTYLDNSVLNEFRKESLNGRRQEVNLIDYDTLVMEILKDYANGEIPYKYSYLLNFSSVFQEAVTYVIQKMDVPIILLVKVVKVLLFYLREESLKKIKKMEAGFPDPIKAMAERQTNFGSAEDKKKEVSKKGDSTVKVRPASATKEDTELLKRGEGAKFDQRIDDAPVGAYFNLYVLLTGFYKPGFPLELIKAGIPLHGLICIDCSNLTVKQISTSSLIRPEKRDSQVKHQEINNFWEVFLKMIWDPAVTFYFKDTIFQVYTPKKFICNKKKLREFIYKEICYLMYDMSDLKRQLDNYLGQMKLWDVTSNELEIFEGSQELDNLPGECITVPVVLQYIIDAVCETEKDSQRSLSIEIGSVETEHLDESLGSGMEGETEACQVERSCSQELEERGDINLLGAYLKTKELDVAYELNDKSISSDDSVKAFSEIYSQGSQVSCNFRPRECGENMEEALLQPNGIFGSYWRKYQKCVDTSYDIDYSLYPFLMMKVFCSFQPRVESSPVRSYSTFKKNSEFEQIENLSEEMRKPHFTVTEGSRSILRSVPYNVKNISRDFFCPEHFKIVSPEKLKASSAPEFRVTPSLRLQTLFKSDLFPDEVLKNPYERLEGFVDDCFISNTDGFDFVEFLSKPKLLEKEYDYWNSYNCVDHAYSFLNDSLFLLLHNRRDGQNIHHETFNEVLKTNVGLRDFYDYIMEDESEWLEIHEELHDIATYLANNVIERNRSRNFSDSEFWLFESLKYQNFGRSSREAPDDQEKKKEHSSIEELIDNVRLQKIEELQNRGNLEGYNISDMVVQFSGLKTIYYSNECSVAVQLIERLYGNQDLGVHVTAASHTLHLYSYVCPEPHILDPFTFHVSYKNGIIVAFGRRFTKTMEEIEERVESRSTLKGKKNSLELFEPVIKKQVSKTIKDDEYLYDMVASLPNGLSIRTVRRIVKPSYIKQHYIVKTEDVAKIENSRLFLPNGNLVKMMANDTIEILKPDSSILTGDLKDLIYDSESGKLDLVKFQVISGDGYDSVFEEGVKKSSKRLQIFQNTDLETNQIYFRRRDGTNYMMQDNGVLCVQFKDGTRMSSSLVELEDGFSTTEDEFVFVHLEIISEHPDYATTIYNTLTEKWMILLPHDSKIAVEPNGCYSLEIDKRTEVQVKDDFIEMVRFSSDGEPLCTFTADLSVFDNPELATYYCQMKDSTGKTFTVEGNSNCYVVDDTTHFEEAPREEVRSLKSEKSELLASVDLQTCSLAQKTRGLSRENKYFVIKRDVTGVELLHKEQVSEELSGDQKGSLVFTLNIPGMETRCFVLITPIERKKMKKWEVETILPNPKYQPNSSVKTVSSTYGVPPSWMHPFPKKKTKFVTPQPLTCRVFVETKRTNLTPKVGTIDCNNCEIEEVHQMPYSKITPEGVEEFLRKLSNDDQDILTEMYTLAVASLINEKKNQKPVNSKKLKHYLEMSRYCVEMREYHKKCIRYNVVPNYFHHPIGMSWLILNDSLLKLKISVKKTTAQVPVKVKKIATIDRTQSSSKASLFSNEEIEYNLSSDGGQSFSELSYRSDLSVRTAPEILRTGGVRRCKVKAVKDFSSSPALKFSLQEQTSAVNLKESHVNVCSFREKDIDKIEMMDYKGRKTLGGSLEDLMHLGLI